MTNTKPIGITAQMILDRMDCLPDGHHLETANAEQIKSAIDALCDGEYLAHEGYEDEDIPAIEEAMSALEAAYDRAIKRPALHIDGLPEKIDRNAREIWERMVEIGSLASCISAVEPEIGDKISKEVGIICEALNRLRHTAQMSDHYCEE